jgi:hypothetical protein
MRSASIGEKPPVGLCAGEFVEVRSKEEILATLDENGAIDALPFMPEMLQYCGQRVRVYKRADKTCDTVNKTGLRRMKNAVHLEGVRCDGRSHGGCQAGCLLFWKEHWLKRVESQETPIQMAQASTATEKLLYQKTRARPHDNASDEVFSCQATELPKATCYLALWDIRQYVRDIRSGNVGPAELCRAALISFFNGFVRILRQIIFRVGHWVTVRTSDRRRVLDTDVCVIPEESPVAKTGVTDRLKMALDRRLVEYPHIQGRLARTPTLVLGVQPGEFVQVKTKDDIVATLDRNNRNRGLLFDAEMVPYCGGTYRVLRRVEQIIDERTGKMLKLPNSCIVLDDVVCRSCLSSNRLFCPRSIYSYWREIWLRKA